ncbi:hypothetical protein ACXR2U_07010 [Jatrophihabitans sp. YIM 134969]
MATVENFSQTNGLWQGNACSGAGFLVPASAAPYAATGLSFAGAVVVTDAAAGLGQPKAMRTHKSITRPGNPPRGRHR